MSNDPNIILQFLSNDHEKTVQNFAARSENKTVEFLQTISQKEKKHKIWQTIPEKNS